MSKPNQTIATQKDMSEPPAEGFQFQQQGVCKNCGEAFGAWVFSKEGPMYGFPIPYLCSCRSEQAERERQQSLATKKRDKERALERVRERYLETLPRGLHVARVNNYHIRPELSQKEQNSCKAAKGAAADYIRALQQNIIAGRGLILIGNTGVGKSHLAAAIGNAAATIGYGTRFVNAQDLIQELRACEYGDTSGVMIPLKRCSFLIFDDIGTEWVPESGSGWVLAQINEIVKCRNANRKPTIFTTNLLPEEIQERYTGRTADCILEAGLNQIVKIACKSYRQKEGI